VPVLVIGATLAYGLISGLEFPIRDAFFGWLPSWFLDPIPIESAYRYSAAAWTITLGAFAVLNIFVAPIVEELYFRGYLLPRMGQFGRMAPIVNVVLFSLYHFWSPWQFVSRIAGAGPYTYEAWRRENVWLAVAVHMILNVVGTLTVIALIEQRLR
jgi:membrane protease YdiL (CAAX protease family)